MTINDCFTRIMSQLYLCIIKHPPSLLKTIAPVHFKLTTTTHRITTPAVSLCASMPCALASVPCHEGVANRFPARSAFPRKATEAETHAYNLIPTQNTLGRPTTHAWSELAIQSTKPPHPRAHYQPHHSLDSTSHGIERNVKTLPW